MIEFVTGDFFDYEADIRINTVNCVGVMGAGVALEFKKRYPKMFKAYVDVCKNNKIEPGVPFLWEEYDLFSTCIIINLPTKIHWKDPSEYIYIEKDLIWLRDYLKDKKSNVVVTLPALGCGHGGLNWNIVKERINYYLKHISAKVLVFEPSSSNKNISNSFSTPNTGTYLQERNIKKIRISDDEYSEKFKEFIQNEIYCIGNEKLLDFKMISLICSNLVNEKESLAVFKVLQELEIKDFVLLLSLNNKKQLQFAKKLLEKGYNLVLIIPYGICNYKFRNELMDFKDNSLVLSYLNPNQEFKKYEYLNSFKIRLAISDIIIYCNEDYENIKKSFKYLVGYKNLFYINFWTKSIDEFVNLKAKKIGVSARTNKANVKELKKYIDLFKS